jgi:hypothetical protein
VQLDLHFKDIDLSAGQITKDKTRRSRHLPRSQPADLLCPGYTNIITRTRPSAKRVGYLKGDHPERGISARAT